MGTSKKKIQPSFKFSLFVILTVMTILVLGITLFDADLHVLLIIALSFSCIMSYKLGYSFEELTEGMKKSISEVMPALMIFILIGVIISSWMSSGTVPAIIYYGLQFIKPKLFLPIGLILCSVTSMATGTSWGTVGTIGIALMGMGSGLGIPAPITAGMIISGAYFGDKMSPISDTTNLSAAAAGADLYDHIKSMSYTTIPSYIIALIIYTLIGLRYTGGIINTEEVNLLINTLGANFNMNLIVFLPMIVLFTLNIKRTPAVPAMVIGAAVAAITAVVVQHTTLNQVISSINYGYSGNTGVELVDRLLNRGGIQGMMWTFSLAFIAISLGGVLGHVGYLKSLIHGFIHKVHNTGLLSIIVILSTIIGNAAMGEVYLSLILNGNLYKDEFKKKGLKPSMLSRYLEEGGTLTEAFIPWTAGAAFIASTLGIETFKYAPYALLNYINPLVSIIFSFMGIFVLWESKPIKEKVNINKSKTF
ncbi:malate-2H(+)/Na(+)-lactate antiporter [Clostridium acetireducens DSM 10703]|jgi:NhaC family Na+:H+ antiporter|uniref:Malate-2H(+)/Na(+)-lactate antiporter n=1 Tax=Clostridium acetireducens DSM 10703 TaxID=1121290 RepID=A0A1E8EXL1_9CLOT|nr:Na+/H+ antiporter NhaC [Clostridium acetireducens]OFI05505.1 malate-2H(+)/Na(+)-lactate antiporter [Clostridium acetireducens DSM 10703]